MIVFPSDWGQRFGANVTAAYPPGLPGVRFRYHEQIAPRPRFSVLVRDSLARSPELRVHQVGDVTHTVTREGELGARVVVAGLIAGRPCRQIIAATFVDDMASVLEALATREETFAQVEAWATDLARAQVFGLAVRPRRFFYTPPPGWQALPSGLVATWYPPDFPANRTIIVVPPALPIGDRPPLAIEEAIAQLGGGLEVDAMNRAPITWHRGLAGISAEVSGRRASVDSDPAMWLHREGAYLWGDGWAYRMHFETTSSAGLPDVREVFTNLVRSVHPMPSAESRRIGTAFAARSTQFDHWAT